MQKFSTLSRINFYKYACAKFGEETGKALHFCGAEIMAAMEYHTPLPMDSFSLRVVVQIPPGKMLNSEKTTFQLKKNANSSATYCIQALERTNSYGRPTSRNTQRGEKVYGRQEVINKEVTKKLTCKHTTTTAVLI